MLPVSSHGATKITMNSQESDYQEKLRQARAQGDGNPYVSGEQYAASPAEQPPAVEAPQIQASEQPQEPQQSEPNQVGTDALQQRLKLFAEAGSNAGLGNNDRSETTRIG